MHQTRSISVGEWWVAEFCNVNDVSFLRGEEEVLARLCCCCRASRVLLNVLVSLRRGMVVVLCVVILHNISSLVYIGVVSFVVGGFLSIVLEVVGVVYFVGEVVA